jgi:hypothetical protein
MERATNMLNGIAYSPGRAASCLHSYQDRSPGY